MKQTIVFESPYKTRSGYGARSRDIIKSLVEITKQYPDKYELKILPSLRWGSSHFIECNDFKEYEITVEGLNGFG